MIVQRAFADADFGGDGVDAHSPDAARIEQLVGGFQDPLFHGWFFGHRSHYTDRYRFALTALPVHRLITQVCVPKYYANRSLRLLLRGKKGEQK